VCDKEFFVVAELLLQGANVAKKRQPEACLPLPGTGTTSAFVQHISCAGMRFRTHEQVAFGGLKEGTARAPVAGPRQSVV
jgi:hypothetical protein